MHDQSNLRELLKHWRARNETYRSGPRVLNKKRIL